VATSEVVPAEHSDLRCHHVSTVSWLQIFRRTKLTSSKSKSFVLIDLYSRCTKTQMNRLKQPRYNVLLHLALQFLTQYSSVVFKFGLFSSVWCLIADVSEHCVCSIFIGEWIHPLAYEDGRHSVPKRRLLNTIRRRTTQKVTHDIQNTAKA
jgi:hypothetical protein